MSMRARKRGPQSPGWVTLSYVALLVWASASRTAVGKLVDCHLPRHLATGTLRGSLQESSQEARHALMFVGQHRGEGGGAPALVYPPALHECAIASDTIPCAYCASPRIIVTCACDTTCSFRSDPIRRKTVYLPDPCI